MSYGRRRKHNPRHVRPYGAIHADLSPVFSALDSIAQGELQLTKMCIAKRNPKSYCAWFHRQWVVDRCVCWGAGTVGQPVVTDHALCVAGIRSSATWRPSCSCVRSSSCMMSATVRSSECGRLDGVRLH